MRAYLQAPDPADQPETRSEIHHSGDTASGTPSEHTIFSFEERLNDRRKQTSTSWRRFLDLTNAGDALPTYRAGNRRPPRAEPGPVRATGESVRGQGFRMAERRMRVQQDYYMLLSVRREATLKEIERAYRRYVRRIHPDKFYLDPERRKRGEDRLKAANMAMQILRNPELRARYDAAWLWA